MSASEHPKPAHEKGAGTLGSTVPESDVAQRFRFVVETGKKIFGGTALVDPTKPIGQYELDLIRLFFRREQGIAPTRPDAPWRLSKLTNSDPRFNGPRPDGSPWRPVDGSYFSNWETPGGPLEHMVLAQQAGEFFASNIKKHLRADLPDEDAQGIRSISPKHVAAAGGLHDIGRAVTHTFWSTDKIGGATLGQIGVRGDLLRVMPDEAVMQLPLDQDMDDFIDKMDPEAVIVRIADEFGKRQPHTNHTYTVARYDVWAHGGEGEKWAADYTSKPPTGLKYDRKFRGELEDEEGERNQSDPSDKVSPERHVANVGRYFAALDKWVQKRTDLTLDELTTMFREHIDQTNPLPPL